MSGLYKRNAGKTKVNSRKASIFSSEVKSGECNKNYGVNKLIKNIVVKKSC